MTTSSSGMTYRCNWCGMIHEAVCPRVKSMEYYPDGMIKHVEFHSIDRDYETIPGTDLMLAIVDKRLEDARAEQDRRRRLNISRDETGWLDTTTGERLTDEQAAERG